MKTNIRILSIVCLIAVYCLAIGGGTKSYALSNSGQKEVSSQEQFNICLSTKLFCHTFLFENAVNNNSLPVPNLKNSFIDVWAITNSLEALFETIFSQYSRFSTNTLINHRKSDIIFPFHYFW